MSIPRIEQKRNGSNGFMMRVMLYRKIITSFLILTRLKKKGWYKHPEPIDHQIFLREFIESPERYPLDTPSGKIELFSEKIDSFQYSDCVGHPKWYEDKEYLGNASKYKLHLLSNQPKFKLHSQLDQGKVADNEKSEGRAIIEVNKRDATARGLSDGVLVRVFNDRGSCLAVMKTSENILPGVANIPTGAWLDPAKSGNISCVHGNPNVLTKDSGTSKLAQGPSAHTCLIEIELFQDEAPEITAFDPPKIRNLDDQGNLDKVSQKLNKF